MTIDHDVGSSNHGYFGIGETSHFGELKVAGSKTNLKIIGRDSISLTDLPNRHILGELSNKTKVSLLDCNIPAMPQGYRNVEGTSYFADIFPHFSVFGRHHLKSIDSKISIIEWTLPDLKKLFYDYDAFGTTHEPEKYISEIVEGQAQFANRKIAVGDRPIIKYFTGKSCIYTCEFEKFEFKVHHRVQESLLDGPQGVWIKNTVVAALHFKTPVEFKESIRLSYEFTSFLGIVAGKPQNLTEWALQLVDMEEWDRLMVVPSLPLTYPEEWGHFVPGPADTLLDGVRRQDEFSAVLKHWIMTNAEMAMPRSRLWDSFVKQETFNVDRLIAAANLFDTIPSSHFPDPPKLDQKLLNAIEEAKKIFGPLEKSPEKESILRELSRVQKNTLRTKVKHWAKNILTQQAEIYKDLEFAIDQAIYCRNYYVHGSNQKFDYQRNLELFAFLIRTLEFCYVVPEFQKVGWANETKGKMHPFGEYTSFYSDRYTKLRSAVENHNCDPLSQAT